MSREKLNLNKKSLHSSVSPSLIVVKEKKTRSESTEYLKDDQIHTESSESNMVWSFIKSKLSRDAQLTEEKKQRCWLVAMDIILCNLVRLVLVGESAFWLYYTVGVTGNNYIIITAFMLPIILADGVYLSVFRHGKEHTWFLISIFFYTLVNLVYIWEISLIKTDMPNNNCPNKTEELSYVNNFWMTNTISLCTIIQYYIASFTITIIIVRFIQPTKSRMTREHVIEMLLDFIFFGSDIVEFYSTSDQDDVQEQPVLVAILVLFSMACIQFSFSIAAKRRRRRKPKNSEELRTRPHLFNHPKANTAEHNDRLELFLEYVFGTEIWTTFLTFILQDFPFLILRIYIISVHFIDSYTFFYLLAKNVILCYLEIYRIVILIHEKMKEESESNESQAVPIDDLKSPVKYLDSIKSNNIGRVKGFKNLS